MFVGQGVGSDRGALLGLSYLKENPEIALQIQYHADMTPEKERWNCQVCVGKDMESMHGQEEQDSGICRRCVGLKTALAARRGHVKQMGFAHCWE